MSKNLVSLTFLGAAGTVTGSRYLLRGPNITVLVDCGLFQGYKYLREKNWQPFPVDPATIDAVFLTHAHLDHSGYLPVLVREGFKGPVFCTQATYELCEILLLDSAKIQERDAFYRNKHATSRHTPAKPLYGVDEAKVALSLFQTIKPVENQHAQTVDYREVEFNGVRGKFHPNGHILGSSAVEITLAGKKIVFSGDVGRPNDLIMRAPQPPAYCDYLLVESTYGDRLHDQRDLRAAVAKIINSTVARGGSLLIPAFAVGRAQSILFLLQELRRTGDIPKLPIYLDSPMAISTTELMCRHHPLHRLNQQQCRNFSENITFLRTVEESMMLNTLAVPAIIVSASGMATGGRVLHHLRRMLDDHRNTILFAGYQAGGTRGARLVKGEPRVKIHGRYYDVKAQIEDLEFLSAHADYEELLDWLRGIPTAPKKTYIVHGEAEASDQFRTALNEELGWPAQVAELGQTVFL